MTEQPAERPRTRRRRGAWIVVVILLLPVWYVGTWLLCSGDQPRLRGGELWSVRSTSVPASHRLRELRDVWFREPSTVVLPGDAGRGPPRARKL
jgi:hypothetical protein